jgi:hypothetical protein
MSPKLQMKISLKCYMSGKVSQVSEIITHLRKMRIK